MVFKLKNIGAVFAASIALAGVTSAHAAPAAPPAGDAQKVQKTFQVDGCGECHGSVGQGSYGGGISAGPKLAPMKLPFLSFIYQLRTPRGNMPPYEVQVLSDQDAADIYAYLQKIKSKPVSQIPILKNLGNQ